MSSAEIVVVEFVVTREHWPHVIDGWANPNGEGIRYSIRVPADTFPGVENRAKDDGIGPAQNASSTKPPIIVPGDGGYLDNDKWDRLLAACRRWKYSPEQLLIGRPIQVAGYTWEKKVEYRGRFDRGGTFANIEAIQVGGDLDKDEGLEIHIKERKAWFNGQ